jgi:hypothetical protein
LKYTIELVNTKAHGWIATVSREGQVHGLELVEVDFNEDNPHLSHYIGAADLGAAVLNDAWKRLQGPDVILKDAYDGETSGPASTVLADARHYLRTPVWFHKQRAIQGSAVPAALMEFASMNPDRAAQWGPE